MPQLAQGALAAALLFSALGAVIVCVLVVLFGFTGPEDEPPLRTARRLMYTRIGHALATTCFAATAILIGMVLLRAARIAPPTAEVRDAPVPALGARFDQQAARVTEIESRARDASAGIARAESRLRTLEQSLGRLVEEGQRTEQRVGRLEHSDARAAALRASTSRKPPTAAPPVATRTEPTPPPPPVRVVPTSPAPTPNRTSAASPSPQEPIVTPAPVTSPAPAAAGSPSASVSSVEAPAAVRVPPPSAALQDGEPRASSSTSTSSTSSMPEGFRAKLRQDWTAIQKGFESSRDDVRRAFDGTMRKLRELVQ